jgi:lysozyme
MLVAHEGLVLRAYKCPADVWTIGVGHTAAAGPPAPFPGMVVTRQEAMDILDRDLRKFEQRVLRTVQVPLNQHEFDALVSFDFNTGAIHRAGFVSRLNAASGSVQREAAIRGLMDWNKARVSGKLQPVRGLTIRRQDEIDLFLYGDYKAHNGVYKGPYKAGRIRTETPIEVSVMAVSRRTEVVDDGELRSLYTDLRDVLRSLLKQPQSGEFRAAAVAGVGYLAGYVDTANPITRITPTASRIIKLVQRTLNLRADGIVGPATRAAIHNQLKGRVASYSGQKPSTPPNNLFDRPQGNN